MTDADAAAPQRKPVDWTNFNFSVGVSAVWFGLLTWAHLASGVFWLLAPSMLSLGLSRAPASRSRAEFVRTRVRFPVLALVVAVVLGTAVASCELRKEAGFVWDAMPPSDAAGESVDHPGVYTHDFMGPADRGSWYGDGGPYVPLATDTPERAAERLSVYLVDRFDLTVDSSRVQAVFEAHPPNWDANDGRHPYVGAILATEREFEAAAGSVLARRLGLRLILALLLGAFAIRLQFKDLRLLRWAMPAFAVIVCVWVLVARFGGTNVEYAIWQWLAPVDRLHAASPWPWNLALLTLTAGLLAWTHRAALRESADLPETAPPLEPA